MDCVIGVFVFVFSWSYFLEMLVGVYWVLSLVYVEKWMLVLGFFFDFVVLIIYLNVLLVEVELVFFYWFVLVLYFDWIRLKMKRLIIVNRKNVFYIFLNVSL